MCTWIEISQREARISCLYCCIHVLCRMASHLYVSGGAYRTHTVRVTCSVFYWSRDTIVAGESMCSCMAAPVAFNPNRSTIASGV